MLRGELIQVDFARGHCRRHASGTGLCSLRVLRLCRSCLTARPGMAAERLEGIGRSPRPLGPGPQCGHQGCYHTLRCGPRAVGRADRLDDVFEHRWGSNHATRALGAGPCQVGISVRLAVEVAHVFVEAEHVANRAGDAAASPGLAVRTPAAGRRCHSPVKTGRVRVRPSTVSSVVCIARPMPSTVDGGSDATPCDRSVRGRFRRVVPAVCKRPSAASAWLGWSASRLRPRIRSTARVCFSGSCLMTVSSGDSAEVLTTRQSGARRIISRRGGGCGRPRASRGLFQSGHG